MFGRLMRKHLCAMLVFLFLISASLESAIFTSAYIQKNILNNGGIIFRNSIKHEEIIEKGFRCVGRNNFSRLLKWFCTQPMIKFATYVFNTLNVKFVDGSYILIIESCKLLNISHCYKTFSRVSISSFADGDRNALLLNPFEHVYGGWYCREISKDLQHRGYNVVYKGDNEVNLGLVRYNLCVDILYMDTHAGCWDIDGDGILDEIVVSIGETWDDDTGEKYHFEYENKMIVEVKIGDEYFVAFTPGLIRYYYQHCFLPNSLVYIAACYAAYDRSMADSFLDAGAKTYMGWSRETVFWTNSMVSVIAFRLLYKGFTVKRVCELIGYGGLFNVLFKSKLVFYGDGNLKI